MSQLPLKFLLVIIGIIFILYGVLRAVFTPIPQQAIPSQLPQLAPHASLEEFQIGSSIDMSDQTASPSSLTKHRNWTTLEYDSEQPAFPHMVIVNNEKQIIFIKEQIGYDPSRNYTQISRTLGSPDFSLFSQDYDDTHRVLVFANRGVALTVQTDVGLIKQVYYFESLPPEKFMKTWSDYFRLQEYIHHDFLPTN